jgi:hypothetical protein
MSYTVIKKVGKHSYAYQQTSYRVGKKVKTKSVYLGPAHLIHAVALAAAWGVHKAIQEPPRNKADLAKSDTAARRDIMGTGKSLEQEAWDMLNKRGDELRPRERAVRDAWTRKMSTMSRDEWERHIAWAKNQAAADKAAKAASFEQDAPQPPAGQSPEDASS